MAACGGGETILSGDATSRGTDQASTATAGNVVEQAAVEQATEQEATDSVAAGSAQTPAATATPLPELDIVTPEPVAEEPELFDPAIVGAGGAVERRGSVEFVMGETYAGSTNQQAFIEGRSEPSDQGSWLITNLGVETGVGVRWSLASDNFALAAPDGTLFEADSLFGVSDAREYSVLYDGRTYDDLRISFLTPDLVTDTTGWHLVVRGGDSLPTLVPLSGPAYYSDYPSPLSDGDTATVSVAFTSCAGGDYSVTVERAFVDIEGPGAYANQVRVPAAERLVVIDLAVSGLQVFERSNNCGLVSVWDEFVLMVDGRPAQPFGTTDEPQLEGFATATLNLSYQVPSDASRLELVSGTNAGSIPISAWDVAFDPAIGEVGAVLIPSDDPAPEPALDSGERPTTLVTTQVADGVATGNMLFVDYALSTSTATSASPGSIVSGSPQLDDEGRTWLIAAVEVQNTSDGNWSIEPANFVLEDPQGRPHGAAAMFDRTGKREYSLLLNGPEFKELDFAFETDGLIDDTTGWRIVVHNGNDIPVVLPLAGEAAVLPFPLELPTGVPAQVGTDPYTACASGGLIDLEIVEAKIDIEGPLSYDRWGRTSEDKRYVIVDLKATHIQPEESGLCGYLPIWPEFLLDADGRLTRAFRYDSPGLEYLESGTFRVNYEIPTETQSVSLVAGSGREVVATWDLRDPSEVLQDFGATRQDGQTLITLDQQVLFAFGESELQQSATAPLTRVASVVSSASTGQIEIVGHTDAIGDDTSNQELSLARAEAVAAALEEAGVDPARLVVSGQGESSPIAPNENDDGSDNPGGRERNRRVEIFFTSDN